MVLIKKHQEHQYEKQEGAIITSGFCIGIIVCTQDPKLAVVIEQQQKYKNKKQQGTVIGTAIVFIDSCHHNHLLIDIICRGTISGYD